LRRSTKVLLTLLLVVGLPYYWLLIDNRSGGIAPARLDIAQLRAEANRMPGAKPTSVDFEVVGFRRLPGTYYTAGTGIKRRLFGIMAYRVNTSDGAIVINSGVTAEDCEVYRCEAHFAERQAGVDRAMQSARMILFTSEDRDHLGGFIGSRAFPRIAGKVLLAAGQEPGGQQSRELPWPDRRDGLTPPMAPVPIQAVAPGVVLVRTGGHSPGSQMVFLQLQDGRELLLAGDVAPFYGNYKNLRAGSRLKTDWVEPEDRTAQFAWLKAIRALKVQAPQVKIIPGHDPEYMLSVRSGRPLHLHFENLPAAATETIPRDPDDN
jgi:glyoxylase-like metal-dependent hydrolase (beta-lactamase superfamily II)